MMSARMIAMITASAFSRTLRQIGGGGDEASPADEPRVEGSSGLFMLSGHS
jgi:hypothetical protein